MTMNAIFQNALLLACGTLALAAQETEIHCTDGSRIRGSLLGIGADRVEFGADFLAAPVPLRLDKVLELSLPVHPGDPKGDHVATVTLSNGDVLRGELTGVNETEIRLRTWYAGELTFRRVMVDTLEIQDRPEILYTGPNGLEGWVQETAGSWIFENGSLRANRPGGIARELKLPVRARFAFDLAWRTRPGFRFLFYSDAVKSDHPSNCYELICQGRYVQLQKRWSKDNRSGSMTLGDFANVAEFQTKEKCRIEMLVDRKSGVIRMIVNGRIVKDWVDADPAAGSHGGGFHFSSQDASPLRVSRIEVTSWDGMLEGSAPAQDEGMMDEEDTPVPATEAQPDPTRIRLRNNDQIAGEMLSIEEGKVKLKTTFGEVNLPVSRLRTFALRTKEARDEANWEMGLYEIPKRYSGDVRAWFPDGGSVTFRLTGVENGKLKGSAQPFGSAEFDQKAFSRIEFNIHDPDLAEARGKTDAW
jgi:hypothetical protein